MKRLLAMNDKNLEGKLLKGVDVTVGGVVIKNYKLGEIFDDERGLGLDKYYKALRITNVGLHHLGLGEEYAEGLSMFDMAYLFIDIREMYQEFLSVFTYHKWEYNEVLQEFVVWQEDGCIVVNQKNIEDIISVSRKMYCIERSDSVELEPVDSRAAEALKRFQEWERTLPQEKTGVTLDSIIESVTVKGSYNMFDVWDLTPYQLIKTYHRISQVDEYDSVKQGVYAGTIESDALTNLHWATKNNEI